MTGWKRPWTALSAARWPVLSFGSPFLHGDNLLLPSRPISLPSLEPHLTHPFARCSTPTTRTRTPRQLWTTARRPDLQLFRPITRLDHSPLAAQHPISHLLTAILPSTGSDSRTLTLSRRRGSASTSAYLGISCLGEINSLPPEPVQPEEIVQAPFSGWT